MFDFCLEEPPEALSYSTMVPELALVTILLGALYGVFAVLYAAPKGYLGHPKKRTSAESVTSIQPYAPTTEQALGVPAAGATTAAEPAPPSEAVFEVAPPAPAPVQAIYETVQPTPAPVQFSAPSTTSFGAPSVPRKPTRTYRRRTAPVRSTAASKSSLKSRTKKR